MRIKRKVMKREVMKNLVKTIKIGGVLFVLATALLLGHASATHIKPTGLLWGYDAGDGFASAQMRVFDFKTDLQILAFIPDGSKRPPNAFGDGRGVAHDPTDGNIWYTALNKGLHVGDDLIHKTSPTGGPDILTIPVPGTSESKGIGAIDWDHTTTNVIYAAGYQPVAGNSRFYKIDATTGAVSGACSFPFKGGGVGDDTLAVAVLPGLGKVLLTDAGEGLTTLFALDPDTCAEKARYTLPVGVTGIDWDPTTGNLIAADLSTNIYNLGPAPFSTIVNKASWGPGALVEDISLETDTSVLCQSPPPRTIQCPRVGLCTGTIFNDIIYGTPGSNIINGLGGNDMIFGFEGSDIINGGSGRDILCGQDGSDVISGEDGNDDMFGNTGSDVLDGGSGDDRLSGGDGADTCKGGPGVNTKDNTCETDP